METEINGDIISKTNCCRKNKSCLKDKANPCCKVVSCISGELHFVEPKDNNRHHGNCDYQKMFGYSFYCNCPVRKEIYRKYGL